jgi:hypothetical protein
MGRRTSAGRWLRAAAFGLLAASWCGLWLLTLAAGSAGRGAGWLHGALAISGVLLAGACLALGRERRAETRQPSSSIDCVLGIMRRLDRPMPYGTRVRRPHVRPPLG